MSQPFLGEIEFFGFNFAPANWALCAGQTLPIAQNQALFSLLGTVYGGDGIRTFNLPDLRGRVPMGQGSGAGLTPRAPGEIGGEESHMLVTAELPLHSHQAGAVNTQGAAVSILPVGRLPSIGQDKVGSELQPVAFYGTATPDVVMASTVITPSPGAAAHPNMMPYLVLNACIALSGIFPSRN